MDLTGDNHEVTEEEELRKALSLSLGEVALGPLPEAAPSIQPPVYGPALPGDDSNKWALVPVIQDQRWNNSIKSNDDAELARAMEASLAPPYPDNGLRPLRETARGDKDRCILGSEAVDHCFF